MRLSTAVILITASLSGCSHATPDQSDSGDQSAAWNSALGSVADPADEEPQDGFTIGDTKLTVTHNLREIRDIEAFKDSGYLNHSERRITANKFAGYLHNGTAISPSDPLLSGWHFAPWCNVRFTCRGRKWSAELYLGGLAFLTDDSGATGAFLYSSIEAGDTLPR